MKKKVSQKAKIEHHRKKVEHHKKMADHHKEKMITLAKGVKAKRGVEEKMREKKGSSSAGKYKHVAPKDFAGKSGGASKFSFPINDLAHARNALSRAHFAPNPEGIKRAVYKKFPELKKRAMKRHKKV